MRGRIQTKSGLTKPEYAPNKRCRGVLLAIEKQPSAKNISKRKRFYLQLEQPLLHTRVHHRIYLGNITSEDARILF